MLSTVDSFTTTTERASFSPACLSSTMSGVGSALDFCSSAAE
jgi:hypothetical protein